MTSPKPDDMQNALTLEQKQTLYRDGFIVMRNVVPDELIERARARIKRAQKGENLMREVEMTDLVNASPITPILKDVTGPFDPPLACLVAVRKVSKPGDHFNNLGYRERDQPYFAAEPHVDGSMTIGIPQDVQTGSTHEIYQRYIASGPRGDLGRDANVIGHNMVPMFEDPAMSTIASVSRARVGPASTTTLPIAVA